MSTCCSHQRSLATFDLPCTVGTLRVFERTSVSIFGVSSMIRNGKREKQKTDKNYKDFKYALCALASHDERFCVKGVPVLELFTNPRARPPIPTLLVPSLAFLARKASRQHSNSNVSPIHRSTSSTLQSKTMVGKSGVDALSVGGQGSSGNVVSVSQRRSCRTRNLWVSAGLA